jgi:hypothetical protein
MNYYYININNTKIPFIDLINKFELDSLKIFNSTNYLFCEKEPLNINFIEPYCQNYLEKYNYPIIKIKKLQFTTYPNINYDQHPFIPGTYKSLHPDLSELTDDELKYHFFNIGINEGRKYYINQPTILWKYLYNFIGDIPL